MLLVRDAPMMSNPFEFRTKMYEIFYVGGSEGRGPRPALPVGERDNATFAAGKAELEALRAKGLGGDKPGMSLAGSEPVSLPPPDTDE